MWWVFGPDKRFVGMFKTPEAAKDECERLGRGSHIVYGPCVKLDVAPTNCIVHTELISPVQDADKVIKAIKARAAKFGYKE
jgi:hypothetical protein